MTQVIETPEGERIEVGPKGGAGSAVPRYDLIDARALRMIAERLTRGAEKYAPDNWRAVPWEEHVRHAVAHAYSALERGQQRRTSRRRREAEHEELAGFACRALLAAAVWLQAEGVADKVPTGLACAPAPAAPSLAQVGVIGKLLASMAMAQVARMPAFDPASDMQVRPFEGTDA